MLAKISWRILSKPSCLLARTLQGKYFPDASILSAQTPSSASHGWRGILLGRDLLAKNLGWVIGDGVSTRLWDDPWLSLSEQALPIGPPSETNQFMKVSELIHPLTHAWDIPQIEEVLPMYKEAILRLKPSQLGAKDKLCWLKSPSGEYSVKTGYIAAITEQESLRIPPTTSNINWNLHVWKLPTAQKIKLFLWKSLHGALPVGERLMSRQVPISPICPRCSEQETILHLLFQCPYAQEVWSKAPLKWPDDPSIIRSTIELLTKLQQSINLPPLGLGSDPLYPWLCWNLWISRNQLVFQKRSFTHAETLLKAILDAKEWSYAQTPTLNHPLIPSRPLQKSLPLRDETIVICTDAAWNSSSQVAGLGWTVQVQDAFTSGSSTASFVSSPLMAEALAMKSAISAAEISGFESLLIQSDSQLLINAIDTRSSPLELHGILSDIFILVSAFHSVLFKFIPRADNVIADSVAKQALSAFLVTTTL